MGTPCEESMRNRGIQDNDDDEPAQPHDRERFHDIRGNQPRQEYRRSPIPPPPVNCSVHYE